MLSSLPNEVLFAILSQLRSPTCLVRFSLTCRKFYDFVHKNNITTNDYYSQLLWKHIFIQQQAETGYPDIDDDISCALSPSRSTATDPDAISYNNNNNNKNYYDWKSLVMKRTITENNRRRGTARVTPLPGDTFVMCVVSSFAEIL